MPLRCLVTHQLKSPARIALLLPSKAAAKCVKISRLFAPNAVIFSCRVKNKDTIHKLFTPLKALSKAPTLTAKPAMTDEEFKIFLFKQTCILLSGVMAAREGQPLLIQKRFRPIYDALAEEYAKLPS